MLKRATPVLQDEAVVRSEDVLLLADQKVFNNVLTVLDSPDVPCAAFRHFCLYLRLKSSGAPTDIRVEVQFLEPSSGKWHTYKQGPFAALYWEDADLATEQDECFSGDCAGRAIRVKITAVGTTATLTFTVSAAVELYN